MQPQCGWLDGRLPGSHSWQRLGKLSSNYFYKLLFSPLKTFSVSRICSVVCIKCTVLYVRLDIQADAHFWDSLCQA